MKRVVLTGGTGFVGANLARRLLADGHEVHLLVRAQHADWRIIEIRSDAEMHEIDLGDLDRLTTLLHRIRPEWVFHLAAYGAYSTQADLPTMIQTNIVATANIVDAALMVDVEAMVNTGSSSEYGFKEHAPTEQERLDPNSSYAVTKASATLYCRYIAESRGVRLSTLRLYSVYGPYEEPSRLIPTVIVHGYRGALPPLVAPNIARDFVHVSDVCEAYVRAATEPQQPPGAIYNVGTGTQTTIRDVVELARRRFRIATEPTWASMPSREWDTAAWVANHDLIRQTLDWSPRVSFAEGFDAFVAWFNDNPRWHDYYDAATTPSR